MKQIDEALLAFVNETEGKIIIVEGRNDKKALNIIGVSIKNIITINGRPLMKVVDEVQNKKVKEVVILTDFDRKGKMLAAKLTRLLQAYRIHPNSRLRKMFIGLGRHQVEDIKYVNNK